MKEQRKLGLFSSIAVCVGLIVATSCLVSLGTGMGSIGRWFIIPLFAVMFLNMFVAFSFSELHSLMPKVDGGTGQYLLAGLGPIASVVGNVAAYYVTMALSATGEIAMCGMVLNDLFLPKVDYRIISLFILLAFFVVNMFGLKTFSIVQNLVVVLLIGSMVVLGIIGVTNSGSGEVVDYAATAPSFSDIGGVSGIFGMAAVAFWLYIGLEFVIPIAKDMKKPKRDVLLSMILGLFLLFAVQAVLGWAMTNYVDLDTLANDPNGMPHMTFASNMLGGAGRYWMGAVTILAAVSTMNTCFASTSKIMQGMGEAGMIPKIFARSNKRGAATTGLIFMGGSIAVMLLTNFAATNGITFIILAASCFWLTTYCMVHISVLRLRKKYPDHPRKKWLTLAGIPQILGIIGNIYMIWNIDTGKTRLQILGIYGVIFVVLTVYAFIWVCAVKKAKPFTTVSVETINKGLSFEDSIDEDGKITLAQEFEETEV